MKELIAKYEQKLIDHGLCDDGRPVIGGLDDELEWNRDAHEINMLKPCFEKLNINSLLFAQPTEPYFSILNYLAKKYISAGEFCPEDTETRTFLHSIPVCKDFTSENIIQVLKKRKSLFIIDKGIVCYGTVTPEQAFVTFSSVCFASFVKFFTDFYQDYKHNNLISGQKEIYYKAIEYYKAVLKRTEQSHLQKGPFTNEEEIYKAMYKAGRNLVHYKMVDSFFGNISYRMDGHIYISQTGSSLDKLEGYIDKVSIDGSMSTGLTASSEYSAHRDVLIKDNHSCILHGHPKFSVVLSMLCDKESCRNKGLCYKNCSEKRFVGETPIIPGEVGTGPTGLSKTLPIALKSVSGAIVYGHGLFVKGQNDFRVCFDELIRIEKMCFDKYLHLCE